MFWTLVRRSTAIAALMFHGLPHAWANPPHDDPSGPTSAATEAERDFQEATQLMDEGDYAGACPLLERSQKLDPAGGTLLNLGDCYEHLGRTLLAYRAFRGARDLSVSTSRFDRAEVAALRMKRLASRLHFIQVIPPKGPTGGFSISLDDEELPASHWNTPVPVEPGVHVLRASAPGTVEHRAEITEGPLGAITPYQLPELLKSAPSAPSKARAAPLDGQQIAAISSGGIGVAGLVVGTVFGLRSYAKHRQSDEYCQGRPCLDPRGRTRMEEARRAGDASTAAFIVGGAGLGAAAVLWFVRPFGDSESEPFALDIGPNSLGIRGQF